MVESLGRIGGNTRRGSLRHNTGHGEVRRVRRPHIRKRLGLACQQRTGLLAHSNSVAPRLRSLPRPDERTQSAQYRPIMRRCHCDRLLHLRIRSDTLCGEPSHELELSGRSIPVALVPQPRAIRQPAPFQRTILFGAGHRRDKKEELLLRR